MSKIRVTATYVLEYDTEDGLVSTEDDALEDMKDLLSTGDVRSGEFSYTVSTD